MSRFDACLREVLRHEGGWSDHPKDPGGATMQGITLRTYSKWLGRDATKDELRNIPAAHRDTIYRTQYWDAVRAGDLPPGVDLAVFDMAVNSGPSRAARTLQAALGVQVDGKIGPQTIQAAKVVHPSGLISDYCDSRLAFLRSIAGWETFGRGWKTRVEDVRSVATKMATEPSTP